MDYSIYIIKRNTPESRLLHHAGIDRNTLDCVKWRGRKRINGGFGREPVEWKVEGIAEVEKLCKTIIRILGDRTELSELEERAFERAKLTINGIKASRENKGRLDDLIKRREKIIKEFIISKYPSILEDRVEQISGELSLKTYNSLKNLVLELNILLEGRIGGICEVRREFVKIMTSN